MEIVEFDPKDKYYKAAGFGNPDASHYEYIEYGRKPWQYRNGGASVVPFDKWMKYPRVCAHRGFNTIALENSMPAFGAAIAMGADEIDQEAIDKAHAHGILCNVFWSDDPEETKRYLDMGIDTILTNDYNLISQVVKNK